MSSIRRFLILTLISALVLVIFSAALKGYRATLGISNTLLDNELVELSRAISYVDSGTRTQQQTLFFQVWKQGKLASSSTDALSTPLTSFSEGFSEVNALGTRWRVHTRFNPNNDSWYMVAQPVSSRFTLTDSLTVAAITPFIISVPILALILFFGITWGLSPLKHLSKLLASRQGNDFSTIALSREPSELSPVVTTLNTMFTRLNSAFEREQQFASNAAHELRTPLSVMKINIHNIANELGEKGHVLAPLKADTDRMIHAVNQFLLLTRTSPETFADQREPVNVHVVAQEVISDLYGAIENKNQEIALEGEEAWLLSSQFVLYTLLQNLVSNASKYSPSGAQIIIRIERRKDKLFLSVCDSGPGIPADQRAVVLNRFKRASNSSPHSGSGLGLAIVEQIVVLHGAELSLDESSLGGLEVRVAFSNDCIL
ncbi:two-component sensor histidine kinase [Alteromonas sp. KUL17]|uniref:sensor histidine kinase n=1 Tax=Alteromonas sp. KUL17 TaxID=2480796 RepID=UPI0010377ACB|nr:ATP-binding protein [Alteromonas sp. KUL17]TAP31219.1 two-component sensor histidine kinase [Alteromonas sp. KUL17]GEA01355.1 two-component sensor histidine kinase [Alteromonas sp. KUL17]